MIRPNHFKRALAECRMQYGLWCSLASNITAEIVAGAGYDWLLIDVEHSPNDLCLVLSQLQAMAPYNAEPIVRLPHGDMHLIKQYLDIGARSLLLPNVESAEAAAAIVAATRYPPQGVRGVSVAQRANRYGRVPGYLQSADQDICLVLQIESPKGVAAAADMVRIPGVDALFIGPSDLAANLGHLGNAGHPEVQAAIQSVQAVARAAKKPLGILAPAEADARRYIEGGCTMVGIGSDQGLLIQASDALLNRFRPPVTHA